MEFCSVIKRSVVVLMMSLAMGSAAVSAFAENQSQHDDEIAVYTGTFDPPHNGHRGALERAIKIGHFKKLYILVNYSSKGKDIRSSLDERMSMAREEFANLGVETEFGFIAPQDTGQAIDRIRKMNHVPVVTRVVGEDSFAGWGNLFSSDDIKWIVQQREGDDTAAIAPARIQSGEVRVIPLDHPLSSTKIREMIRTGQDLTNELAPGVRRYIQQRGLYSIPKGDLLGYREAAYQKAFQRFKTEFAKNFPETKELSIPAFNPEQSQRAWQEKFVRAVLAQNEVSPEYRSRIIRWSRTVARKATRWECALKQFANDLSQELPN